MTTRSRLTWKFLGVLILFVASPVWAGLESELKTTYQTHLRHLESNQIKKAMTAIHPKSPIYKTTQQFYNSLAKSYKLKYEVKGFKLVGGDKDYKIARILQRSTKLKGPDFRNNMVDTFQVFRQDGKKWKLWQVMTLEIQFLKSAVSKKPSKKKTK